MKLCKDVIVSLNGEMHLLKEDSEIHIKNSGLIVDADTEVIVDNTRYTLREGESIITEDLYGFRIIDGSNYMDKLLQYVDVNYLDFDLSDQRFIDAVRRIFPRMPATMNEWMMHVQHSSQSAELKEHLMAILSHSSINYDVDDLNKQPFWAMPI